MGSTAKLQTLTETVTMIVEECFKCGVPFAMVKGFRDKRLADGDTFYCPNGHGQCYGEPTELRLRRQLEVSETEKARAERKAEWLAKQTTELHKDVEYAKRSRAATRGQLTKMKNRVADGVCPCCGRTFQQLARHMATKHPDFTEQPVDGDEA